MTAQEIIKSFMNRLATHGFSASSSVGVNMLNSAVRASSRYNGIQDVIAAMKADQVKAEKEAVQEILGDDYADKTVSEIDSDILNADAKDYDTENKSNAYFDDANDGRSTVRNWIKERKADIFLEKYCGIILNKKYWFNSVGSASNWGVPSGNDDTGAITGSDAGGSTVKTASSVVPESGDLKSFTGSSFTVNGVTFQLATFSSSGTPTAINYSRLTDETQKYIWQALYTWWAKNALDLIAQSYGSNYSFNSGASVKKIYIGFSESGTAMASTTGWFTDSSRKTMNKLAVQINMNNYKSMIIGNVDGKMSNRDDYYLDRVLAHELTHAVMYAHINYADELPYFIKEGMGELTHGSDDPISVIG